MNGKIIRTNKSARSKRKQQAGNKSQKTTCLQLDKSCSGNEDAGSSHAMTLYMARQSLIKVKSRLQFHIFFKL
jgi:hypothetical protein